MCRLLYVRAGRPFDIRAHLGPFAELSRDSKEYQGHGWGCAYLRDGEWRLYHDLRPVWDDDLGRFGPTSLLVAHARSAFENRGIRVENNMPFFDGRHVFAFNGELRGVRLRERGRIGAEKVFNFVRRLDRGDMGAALERGAAIIRSRTRRVRGMNVLIADRERAYVSSAPSEDPEYFTMRLRRRGDELVLCSDPYPGEPGWEVVPTSGVEVL
jgi:predicted glutamine amidotransferase